MTQPYECEVRFGIDNIEDFQARLHNLGAKIAFPYEFIDYYYKPLAGYWNPVEKNIRIRQWIQPQKESIVFFVKLEIISIEELQFKRSLYPEGKLPLFTGSIETCRMLLDDLGFGFWFSLRKEKARLWEVPRHDFSTAVEYIEGLGWTAELEFEGQDPHKAATSIRQALDILKIPPQKVTHNPISIIYLQNKKCSKTVNKDG